MGGRTIILLGALAAAGLTAALLGMLAHETLGISRSEIRADALGSAVLLAIVWGASYFREPGSRSQPATTRRLCESTTRTRGRTSSGAAPKHASLVDRAAAPGS
jgi:hypothetical protein